MDKVGGTQKRGIILIIFHIDNKIDNQNFLSIKEDALKELFPSIGPRFKFI